MFLLSKESEVWKLAMPPEPLLPFPSISALTEEGARWSQKGPLDAAWLAQTQGTLLSSGVIPWHWGRLAPSACVTIESL